MEYVIFVHSVDTQQHLLHEDLAVGHAQLLLALNYLVQITIHQLHNNIQAVFVKPNATTSKESLAKSNHD